MEVAEQIEQIESRVSSINWTITDLCDAADLAPSTFHRWKAGTKPGKKLDDVLRALRTEEFRIYWHLDDLNHQGTIEIS